ncbi:hypothetical protein F5878DRAFT_625893 [Lentinula raphanica]|uniref:Uncharacterized protein n=1 Tax=Lentinula raphanica TaxID=153919 RepID=A0AA38UB50_9AGAR|nr:hypothetical protein F5878DRAFT_625893 [Lentinula raphanica]
MMFYIHIKPLSNSRISRISAILPFNHLCVVLLLALVLLPSAVYTRPLQGYGHDSHSTSASATESESFPDDRSDTGLAFNFATAALSVSESVSTVSSSDDILSSSYRGGGDDCRGDCGVFDSPHIMTTTATTATTDPIDPIDSAYSTDTDPIHHTSHSSTPAPPPLSLISLTKRQPPPPPRRYKGELRYHVWFSNDPYSAEPETFTRLSPMGARLPPRVWEEVQMRIHANARGMLRTRGFFTHPLPIISIVFLESYPRIAPKHFRFELQRTFWSTV